MLFTSLYWRTLKILGDTTWASKGFWVRSARRLVSGLLETEARSEVEDYLDRVSHVDT